jgi:signal transduction histidine kinase
MPAAGRKMGSPPRAAPPDPGHSTHALPRRIGVDSNLVKRGMTIPPPASGLREFLSGGGEMGALMRARNWADTPLGDVAGWPQSLKTSVSICLNSRFPLLIWWGPDLVKIYNDAYRPMLGDKHPASLGQPGRDCWPEIWPIIGPMLQDVVARGDATWSQDQMLPLHRHGFSEECYFTFSYSPIRDEGGVGGVFTAVFETTARVIGERRLAILRRLAARAADAVSADEACRVAVRALAGPDVPFVAAFLYDAETRRVRLQCVASASPADSAAAEARIAEAFPENVALDAWPFADPSRTGRPFGLASVVERWAAIEEAFPGMAQSALAMPLARPGLAEPHGFLIAGLSPRLAFDDSYRSFLQLAADQLVTAVGNALAHQQERERAEALAELDRAKTTFFSNVSHEFRTPLTLILGPVEDAVGAQRALGSENLAIVHRNALRLLKLVNSLLDFTRIEAGRASASYEPVDLAEYTAELASTFRSTFERAGLTLAIDCPPAGGDAFVDREMWEKIVLNLVSNAFKFTFEGGVTVSVTRSPDRFVLRVADTGIGIAADEIPRLFHRFHRVEGARSRTHEGTGIGLALVRALVEMHGGTIAVESAAGAGTAFTVEIPAGATHLPPEKIASPRAGALRGAHATPHVTEAARWIPDPESVGPGLPAAEARSRILVVDDNADMRDYLARLLGERYAVATAPDGAAALASIERALPDLVLSDVMMPNLSGVDLLRELRSLPSTRTLPVILLSARAGEVPEIEGLGSGADDYLVKPFSARELLARVASRLELGRARGEAEALLRDAGRRKDEFLAMLAHELRNPLGAIANAVELLGRSGDRPPDLGWARSVIDRQVRHLTEIVDDLLDLSRITEGKIALRKKRVAVADAMALAIETTRPSIAARRQELSVEFPPEDLAVDADVNRLAQVFANLLNNASKYTPEGGKIAILAARDSGQAVIRVRDTGIGIDPDLLPSIFDLFVQADRSLDRSQGGLGIGLTLVRRIMELHDGHVAASSGGAGKGSEFVVSLPEAAEGAAFLPPRAAASPTGVPSRRILVVEDNADSADGLAALLLLDGHVVRTENDGPSAVAAAGEFRPDVILLDIGLPGMSGYEVARALRSDPRVATALLVAVTGYGQDEDRARSSDAGFDHHLVKPLRPEAIARLLRA